MPGRPALWFSMAARMSASSIPSSVSAYWTAASPCQSFSGQRSASAGPYFRSMR
ncbi:MAG: hypothetical protein MZU97_13335 [Bacillus subtilis]|nr:hypothetical protein [Bacillus subtilis]